MDMLQMDGNAAEDDLDGEWMDSLSKSSELSQLRDSTARISEQEFSCHCCYDILVNPTTLTCGHNFCRHCLALWWESSYKKECPECREKWEGFPKVNILLRNATEKLFSVAVQRRKEEIQANPKIFQSLLAFQRYGDDLVRSKKIQHKGAEFFLSGVLTALSCVAVLVLVYHWSSGFTDKHEPLISKPVSDWTPEDVVSWVGGIGEWAQLHQEHFQQENIDSQAQLRAVLAEVDRVRSLRVKPPQTLWEYKDANVGKSLFMLYALKRSPRLTLFYLYVFDYSDTFLPFLHTCCPAVTHTRSSEEGRFLNSQLQPSWGQWAEFLVKYLLLPYQLMAEFAWDWLSVHYWTSRFVIVNTMLLSVLEGCALWRLWSAASIRSLPQMMWSHLWKMLSQGFAFALMWPFVPQFVCNCLFYWALYFSPIINIDLVVKQLMHPDTQAL